MNECLLRTEEEIVLRHKNQTYQNNPLLNRNLLNRQKNAKGPFYPRRDCESLLWNMLCFLYNKLLDEIYCNCSSIMKGTGSFFYLSQWVTTEFRWWGPLSSTLLSLVPRVYLAVFLAHWEQRLLIWEHPWYSIGYWKKKSCLSSHIFSYPL